MLRKFAQLLLSSEIRHFEGVAWSDFGFSYIFLTNSLLILTWVQVRISKDLVRNIQENPKSDLATPSKYRISELKRSWANFRSIG